MMRKLFSSLWLMIIVAAIATAQNTSQKQYILHELVFEIDGMTNQNALINDVGIEEGISFPDKENLLEYLSEMKQDMINKRVFDTVEYNAELIDETESQAKYRATYYIVDSWTFYPIIYPNYDSNTGFRLGMQLYYDNAFGTLTDWYLGLTYDFGTGEYNISPKVSGIDIGKLTFTLSLSQSYNVTRKATGSVTTAEWSYNQSNIAIGTSLDIVGPLSYNFAPSFAFRYSYKDILGAGGFNEDRFGFVWNHGFRASDVDWIENFRDGYSSSLGHKIAVINRDGDYVVVNSLSVTGTYFKAWKVLNFSTKAGWNIIFNDEFYNYGDKIRGVRDDQMYGYTGAYLNATLAIQFWRWVGVWDAQVQPFFDIGLTDTKDETFDPSESIKMGTGIDLVLYIDKLKNLVARGSIGYDLTSDLSTMDSGRFEISISSSLHY